MIAWFAALLLAAEPAPTLAGTYSTHQMEVGAMLELKTDGTFQYMLDYGAVSEAAQGHWSAADNAVRLDSDPLALDLMTQIERSDAAFEDEVLNLDDGALVLRRWDTVFTFYKDEP
jgi:hypothetical protein